MTFSIRRLCLVFFTCSCSVFTFRRKPFAASCSSLVRAPRDFFYRQREISSLINNKRCDSASSWRLYFCTTEMDLRVFNYKRGFCWCCARAAFVFSAAAGSCSSVYLGAPEQCTRSRLLGLELSFLNPSPFKSVFQPNPCFEDIKVLFSGAHLYFFAPRKLVCEF